MIGLPANLFYGTGIPACILLFDRAKGQNRDVLFIDASRDFEQGKNQNHLGENQIKKILDEHKQFRTATPNETEEGRIMTEKYSYRATPEELAENDYNLNIPRYVDTYEAEEPVDMAATTRKISALREEIHGLSEKMRQYLNNLGY